MSSGGGEILVADVAARPGVGSLLMRAPTSTHAPGEGEGGQRGQGEQGEQGGRGDCLEASAVIHLEGASAFYGNRFMDGMDILNMRCHTLRVCPYIKAGAAASSSI